jgi:hypothetical protein
MAETLWTRAVARLTQTWGKYTFDMVAANVLHSAPLALTGDSPIFLSMVCHVDVVAYLLAIKSLYSGFGQGRVLIIDDGSLSPDDHSILRQHIPGLEVEHIANIDTRTCPRGGTWERLVRIIELTAGHYLIQADADTLVTGAIPEVIQCWANNRSFLLGTDVGQRVCPAPAMARLAQSWLDKAKKANARITVGTLAEAALDSLPDAETHRYVHASSGFAGFAKGAFSVADVERFSGAMRDRLAGRWDEWGSEQIASNYILANTPGAVVLPFSRYACFEPGLPPGERSFLHFFGTHRFKQGRYRAQAQGFLARYSGGPCELH